MRRVLKWLAIVAVVIIVPFGVIIVLIPLAVARTISKVDANWHPSPTIIAWTKLWCTLYGVPFKFALSILYNEGASESRALNARELNVLGLEGNVQGYPVGDLGDARGPALGPGQVLRINVERHWQIAPWYMREFVVSTNTSDLALVGKESKSTWVSVKMMQEVLQQADGDLWDAAKRYNGGAGSDLRALAYADKSQNTLERIA